MTQSLSSGSSSTSSLLSALTGSSSSSSSSSPTSTIGGNTGALSSLGIGSGIDVNSIISAIMAADSQPLTDLQNTASSIQTKISTVGQLSSLMSTFQGAASTLASPTFWDATAATSSNTSVLTASTPDGTAQAGQYSVTVQQLAQGQTATMSTPVTDGNSTFDSGTMTIQLGSWGTGTPPSFTAQANSNPVTLAISPTSNTLSDIAQQINSANAGVTASIITDSTGSRLSLQSTSTGATSGFKITTTDDNPGAGPGPDLSSLSYDPSSGSSGLSLNLSAQNAMATVNGIPVQSSTNTLTGVTNGLNLTLQQVSNTPVSVGVAPDTATMTTALNSFVSAYNALNSAIRTDTAYNPSGPVAQGTSVQGGPLEGDPTVLSLQEQMFSVFNVSSTASSTMHSLADLGITIQGDGSLQTNSTKLAGALQNPGAVKDLLTATGTGNADTGLMVQFENLGTQALGPGGLIAAEQSGLQDQLKNNQQQQTDMQTHLSNEQQTLTAQYEALDTTMSQMNALSSYVTQQETAWAKSG